MVRRLAQVLLLGLASLVAYLNYQLYYRPHFQVVAGRPVNQDVVAQLRFLRGPLHHGAAHRMQQLYPEGFVYLNALYGLSWIELLPHLPPTSPLYREARTEAAWAIGEMQSPAGRAPFDHDLPLPYGAFYQGWCTYVQGRYLAAQPSALRDPALLADFKQHCAQLARALGDSTTPYPESYPGGAWPADVVVGAAALAWHDRMQPPHYQPLIRRWLRAVDTRLDSLGLIPHRVEAGSGRVAEAARGSSQSQLLNFLVEVDSAYAYPHFVRYRRHFRTSRLGLPGVREFAPGSTALPDIDTGPIIWEVGGAASIVGRRTMQRYGDTTTAVGLRNSIEAFGLPTRDRYGKRYLFGQLPIADAFIAWSNSVEASRELRSRDQWRGTFQGLSALVILVLAGLGYWLQPRRR